MNQSYRTKLSLILKTVTLQHRLFYFADISLFSSHRYYVKILPTRTLLNIKAKNNFS